MRLSSFFIRRSALCVLLSLPLSAATFRTDGGVTLHYEKAGRGRNPLILLSGGPGFSSAYMRTIGERLKKRHSYVLFDQRGTGKSVLETHDVTTLDHDRLVADLEALRRELKLDKLTLVGHSWGGILSMLYASAHPDRVRAMVLIDAGGPTTSTVPKFVATHTARMTEDDNAKLREANARPATDRKRAILEITRAKTPPYFFDRATALAFAESLDETSFNDKAFWPIVAQMDATFDLSPGLKRVHVPVLIIHGTHDPLESAHDVHAAITGSRLVLIENAGHFPWLEQPVAFYRAVEEFLRGVR